MAREKKSYEERISELQEKQKQLKEQEKKLRAQQSQAERKQRTRHLIEVGGIVYKTLGRDFVDGDLERLAAFLTAQDNRGGYFTKAMNPNTDDPEPLMPRYAVKK